MPAIVIPPPEDFSEFPTQCYFPVPLETPELNYYINEKREQPIASKKSPEYRSKYESMTSDSTIRLSSIAAESVSESVYKESISGYCPGTVNSN